MAVVFSGFAVLQYNDPDGLIWALAYAVVVVLSVAVLLQRSPVGLPLLLVLYSLCFLWLSPELFQRDWIDSEEGRESAGLLVAALWIGALLVAERRGVDRPAR
jgi:hypothetical protein